MHSFCLRPIPGKGCATRLEHLTTHIECGASRHGLSPRGSLACYATSGTLAGTKMPNGTHGGDCPKDGTPESRTAGWHSCARPDIRHSRRHPGGCARGSSKATKLKERLTFDERAHTRGVLSGAEAVYARVSLEISGKFDPLTGIDSSGC